MPTVEETVARISGASSWDDRVARIRRIPANHGTNDQPAIHAEIAKMLYLPHLAPDYAYVHSSEFYEAPHFQRAYQAAHRRTSGFKRVAVEELTAAIMAEPSILLPLRVITGLLKNEFAASTKLVAEPLGLRSLSPAKVDSMERDGTAANESQARIAAATIDSIMTGALFGEPPGDLKSKLDKPDTAEGWNTVRMWAAGGVPYGLFLHQRHYGGAFRQLLDATSEKRGDLIEDAVEVMFEAHGVPHVRTGSHNQAEVARRFEVTVLPAPDFVVYDASDALRAVLECKGANDGGTARDKALRFERLHDEAVRLGGVPLVAVLGGLGWTRVNDTLGPVVRDCDGRVFSVSNLNEMLSVSPFPSLVGTAAPATEAR